MPAELILTGLGLSVPDRAELTKGTLGNDVYVQFVCQTDNGYDVNSAPDARVRPSHAAFHGKVFKLEDAPVPPLDYGCRCAIRYVAAPDSAAAKLVDPAKAEPVTPVQATDEWLTENVDDVGKLKRVAENATKKTAFDSVLLEAKKLGIPEPRSIAAMVVDVVFGR